MEQHLKPIKASDGGNRTEQQQLKDLLQSSAKFSSQLEDNNSF